MTKATHQLTTLETETDIDDFLADHRDEIAAKLNEARDEIARGEVAPLEPLAELLSAARARAGQ